MTPPMGNTERHYRASQDRRAERIEVNGRMLHPKAQHGTPSGYGYFGCQCGACTIGNQMRQQRLRDTRYRHRVTKDDDWFHPKAEHGTDSGYTNYGCRCSPCKRAHADYTEEYRNGRNR